MDKKYECNDLARAHFEIQKYHDRWDPLEGLIRGTVFPELYRSYYVDEPGDSYQDMGKGSIKRRSGKMKGGKRCGKR